ncbi:MAG: CvpA family protein [Bacteroidota bacterium]
MNLIDLLIIGFICYGVIKGFKNGLIIEVFRFIGLFISFFLSTNLDNILSNEILKFININYEVLNIISFVFLFIVVQSLIVYFAKGFTKLAKIVYLGFLNSFLGSVFGGLKILLILLILVKIIFSFNLVSGELIIESEIIMNLHVLSEIIFNSIELINEDIETNLI